MLPDFIDLNPRPRKKRSLQLSLFWRLALGVGSVPFTILFRCVFLNLPSESVALGQALSSCQG